MPVALRSVKFTPKTKELILKSIEQGDFIETACRLANVHPSTFYKWEERARAGEQVYVQFFEAVEVARAKAESEMVRVVRKEATTNWKAAIWWLEKAARNRWGNGAYAIVDDIEEPKKITIHICEEGSQEESNPPNS